MTETEQAKPETPQAPDLVEVLERLAAEFNALKIAHHKNALQCERAYDAISATDFMGQWKASSWAEGLVLAELDAARKARGDG